MRSGALLVATAVVASAFVPAARQGDPFVPMAVEYTADPRTSAAATADDLKSIRALGFNAITAVVRWSDTAAVPGTYAFGALERTLGAADSAGLRVHVRIDTAPPSWLFARYPDGRRITERQPSAPGPNVACFDHPGVRAELRSFIESASRIVSRSPAFYSIDAGGEPPAGFCLCPHTARRFAASAKEQGIDRNDFVRISLRDDLKWMIQQAAPSYARIVEGHARVPTLLQRSAGAYPSQDDWLMSTVVDRYGISLDVVPAPPSALAMGIDGLAAATKGRGWVFSADAAVPARDLRFLTWMSFSRGARAISLENLPDDSAFVAVVSRNPALFAELRPVPASVAVLYDPRAGSEAHASLSRAYDALFRRNIAAEVLHAGELSAMALKRYRALIVPAGTTVPDAPVVKTFSSGGGVVVNAGGQEAFDDRGLERLTKAGVVPEARVSGGDGLVETRFLESPRVSMLIALNHSTRPERVTLTFKPDTQEAIWQNMESGAGVNFIAGPSGPSYSYWFRPRDALVLMIRKDVK